MDNHEQGKGRSIITLRPFCSVRRPLKNGIVAGEGRKMQLLILWFLKHPKPLPGYIQIKISV